MKIWGTYESEAAKILRKKTPIMNKMDEEYTASYDILIHPNLEAIEKRDAFLSDENGKKLREMIDQIHLMEDILDCNNCEYPNECENCARAIENRERK